MHQNEILGGWKTFSNKGLITVVTTNNNSTITNYRLINKVGQILKPLVGSLNFFHSLKLSPMNVKRQPIKIESRMSEKKE